MSVRIQGAEHPLKEIFSDDFVFEIPPYQRPYSWTTEHAGELLEDLVTAMKHSGDDDRDPYFLGSIVLAKQEQDPSAEVIDGQQRLTTLTILLATLAAQSDEAERHELREFILQKGSKLKQTETVYRVTLRKRDATFFRIHVQEPNGLTALLALDKGQLSDPELNIQANADFFMHNLKALSREERSALASYLLNDCFLVAVSTPDTESAFKIFAVLNDRGLDLSHADIIKSELVGQIPDHEQERYTEIWETAEEALGVEAFADLFAHIRMIYAKAKARESLIKEFRNQVIPEIADPRIFINKIVASYSGVYARILKRSWASSSHAQEINRILTWLQRIDNVDWIPPAMLFLRVHEHDPQTLNCFLLRLERLAASLFVRRVNINGRIERYALLLKQIEDGNALSASGSALNLSEHEKADTVAQLNGELYLERRTRNYVLLRLDEALSAGGAHYDQSFLTVEHVLPQTPPADSLWTEWFDGSEREHWVHRLANLVLLPRRRNSAARNFDFETKKARYFSDEQGTSPFVVTTQVLTHKKWTPSVLEVRQEKLLNRLKDVWNLHPVLSNELSRGSSYQ